jgi:competence protein CoiA
MALYAFEEEQSISATDAVERKNYRCIGCKSLVRVRRGLYRVPHFYHLAKSSTCRLYSKSQDHLLVQLAIQKLLPLGESTIEMPFTDIMRVADLIWERPKIAFEIQCSKLSSNEVKQRVIDYAKMGYHVVWILDDRIFNRRIIGEAEQLMRQRPSYYATLRKESEPKFYDQFEIDSGNKRLKKGQRLTIHIQRPYSVPKDEAWLKSPFPSQVLQKIETNQLYFHGDLLHKAFLSKKILSLAYTMHTLRVLEEFYRRKALKEKNLFLKWITKWILEPFGLLMLTLHERAER